MFTAKALDKHIKGFLLALQEGFHVSKAILFGSYTSGKPHAFIEVIEKTGKEIKLAERMQQF